MELKKSPSLIPNIIKDKCKAACPVLTATTDFGFLITNIFNVQVQSY